MLYKNCKKRKLQNANSSKNTGSAITISNITDTCTINIIIIIMITHIIIFVVIITSVLLISLLLLL